MASIFHRNFPVFRVASTLFIVLAVFTGGLFLVACGGGSNDKAVSAMQKLMQVGQDPGTTNKVYLDELPPGLPAGLPSYPGAELVGSVVTTSTTGVGLGVLSESGDSVDTIYAFYEEALATAPWQIEVSTYPGKVAGIQFKSRDDPSMSAAVVVQPASEGDGKSVIFLSIQTRSGAPTAEPFVLGESKPLPLNWPPIPVYPNSVVTDTGWGQTDTSAEWQITLLVQAAPLDVINYYKSELTKIGLPVKDEAPQNETLMMSFAGVQGPDTWNGAISAGTFAQDPTYTQVTIQTALSTSVGATPQPSGTATP